MELDPLIDPILDKCHPHEKLNDESEDYQLSRAFDLILALDLANNKYKQ